MQLTFTQSGDVTITATKAATNKYEDHSATYTLTVTASVIKPQLTIPANLQWGTPVEFVKETGHTYSIKEIENKGNLGVAINGNKVHAEGAMIVQVRARLGTDTILSDQISFGLQEGTTLKFDKKQVGVEYKDGSYQQKATNMTTVQGDTGPISYKLDDPNIATVNQNGEVSFTTVGKVIITATKAETPNKYQAHSAQYTLEIKKSTVQDPKAPIIEGTPGSWRVARTIKDYDAVTYKYEVESGAISIDNGEVKAKQATSGKIRIRKKETATEKESKWVSSQAIIFNLDEGTTLKFKNDKPSVEFTDYAYTNPLIKTPVKEDTGVISYKSSDKDIATVDKNTGEVSFKKNGQVTITVEKVGTQHKYKAQSARYTLTINVGSLAAEAPQLLKIPANLQWGTPVEFKAEPRGYTYSIEVVKNKSHSQTPKPRIKDNKVHAEGRVTVQIKATRGDGKEALSNEISFGLQEGTTLKFNQTQVNAKYKDGSYQQKATNMTTVQGDAGAVSYKSSDDAIATVDGNGTVTFKKGGDVTITATKAETNKYKEQSAQYTLTIGDISITFALHGGILNGDPKNTTLMVQKGQSLNDIGIRQKLTYPSINGVTRTLERFEYNKQKHDENTAITSDISLSVVWKNSCGVNGIVETVHPKDRKTLKELVDKAITKTNSPNLNHIDTSAITDMNGLFDQKTTFNGQVGCWNTSQVTNMSYMFYYATVFDQDIGKWKTSQVENMECMFCSASAFNQDLSSWKVDNVQRRWGIFRNSGMVNKSKWPARFR